MPWRQSTIMANPRRWYQLTRRTTPFAVAIRLPHVDSPLTSSTTRRESGHGVRVRPYARWKGCGDIPSGVWYLSPFLASKHKHAQDGWEMRGSSKLRMRFTLPTWFCAAISRVCARISGRSRTVGGRSPCASKYKLLAARPGVFAPSAARRAAKARRRSTCKQPPCAGAVSCATRLPSCRCRSSSACWRCLDRRC